MKKLLKFLPILIIIALMIVFYVLDLQRFFTFAMLKEQHLWLKQTVSEHYILAPITFIVLYFISVALSLPIAAILSLAMGYVFPFPLSSLYVVIGATIGACLIFLSAKTVLAEILYPKIKPYLDKFQTKMGKSQASYLLTLRLIPVIPFWILNLAPAFLNVPFTTFAWTTFVGIIPGALVFTNAGSGLSTILEKHDQFSFAAIFSTNVIIAFAILIAFSLIPIFVNLIRKRLHRD